MAHTASVGSAKRTVDVAGKRLGVKAFGGEFVTAGSIIIRQKGTKFHPGKNTALGRDFTIFSKVEGVVSFRNMTGFKQGQKYVDVLPNLVEVKSEKKAVATNTKQEEKVAPAKVKKASAPKTSKKKAE